MLPSASFELALGARLGSSVTWGCIGALRRQNWRRTALMGNRQPATGAEATQPGGLLHSSKGPNCAGRRGVTGRIAPPPVNLPGVFFGGLGVPLRPVCPRPPISSSSSSSRRKSVERGGRRAFCLFVYLSHARDNKIEVRVRHPHLSLGTPHMALPIRNTRNSVGTSQYDTTA